jgi:uncharacterized protein
MSAVSKIWRNIPQNYNLTGKICECGSLYFPPREVCTKCGNFDMENYNFEGRGKIVTFTIIRTPISDPEGEINETAFRQIPYILAIIKLDEGPMLTTEIVDTNIEDIKIGQDVDVVFRKILEKGKQGVIQYGYKFKIT